MTKSDVNMTETNNKNAQNNNINTKQQNQNNKIKQKLNAKIKQQNNRFKQKYFEFYDDVKTHNNGPYDW